MLVFEMLRGRSVLESRSHNKRPEANPAMNSLFHAGCQCREVAEVGRSLVMICARACKSFW
jgi:hypothetical protein